MTVWTVHTADDGRSRLVRDGFSWGATLLGPFWLAAFGAWMPAALLAVIWVAVAALAGTGLGPACGAALAVLTGYLADDMRRWSLDWRGYRLVHVVAAADEDAALARLLDRRPDLVAGVLR